MKSKVCWTAAFLIIYEQPDFKLRTSEGKDGDMLVLAFYTKSWCMSETSENLDSGFSISWIKSQTRVSIHKHGLS